jgi:hypothetical protein
VAVTARVRGAEAGGAALGGMDWVIEYDDQTRNVTAHAEGQGHCFVTVTITRAITRTLAFVQPGQSMAADFVVTVNTGLQTLATNVNPNQLSRIVCKAGS